VEKLEYLRARSIGECTRCELSRTRTSIVFGVGDPQAAVMLVGEAPGGEEDLRGEPFVGRAGQRLDRWIEQAGLSRSAVYIANVIKCRPPNNRDPHELEIARCSPFLDAQIRAIAPKVLVAVGKFAAALLTRSPATTSLTAMRRMQCSYAPGRSNPDAAGVPVVATYHPAYVLRQGVERGEPDGVRLEAEAVADLQRAFAIAARRGAGADG
jgi:DNA polymerase